MLPEPVALLRRRYPKVNVSLHQGTPEQVAQMLLDESADIGLATESLADFDELVTLPCYEWQHMLVVPLGHPLAAVERPTLEQLAAEPLVTYHPSFTGRARIDAAFARARLVPDVVLEAIDSDVIKTYVRLGLGVGIVAEMAVRDEAIAGGDMVVRPLGHLFGQNVSRVAFKRGAYLRNFVYTFAELLVRSADAHLDPSRHDRRRRRRAQRPCHVMTPLPRTPIFPSRLPQVGTTIFTVMSALAQEHAAVNLGQGFPDFECDPALLDAVGAAMRAGLNQYPPMAGVPALREAIAAKIEALYGASYDPAARSRSPPAPPRPS